MGDAVVEAAGRGGEIDFDAGDPGLVRYEPGPFGEQTGDSGHVVPEHVVHECVYAVAGGDVGELSEQQGAETSLLVAVEHGGLFTAAPRELALDFEGIVFMDSSGIRTIIELSNQLRAREGRLVLDKVPDTPRRVLEVSGLQDYLELR